MGNLCHLDILYDTKLIRLSILSTLVVFKIKKQINMLKAFLYMFIIIFWK